MATFYVHNIVSPKCSWGNFEQFKVHVSSRQKKKMVKSADFDGNMSIFWLKYILHMVLLHTRWLVSMGIFVLPFGPILNTVKNIMCDLDTPILCFTQPGSSNVLIFLKKTKNSQNHEKISRKYELRH